MPKLPGFESLGGVQTDATRPVGNYDVSPLARGGQAIAQGVETLGKGVQTAATDVAQVQIYRERNQALLAQDQALGEAISLREKYQPGGDKYTSDPDALTNSYQTDLDAIAAKHLNTIPAGALREHAAARLQIPFAHEVVSVAAEARKRQIGDFRSGLMNEADQLINTTGPTDDPLHTAQMQQWGTKVQLGKEQGFLTPGEAEELQKKTARGVIDGEFRARFRSGRAEAGRALMELEGAQSGDPYTARLFHIESGGDPNARTGSNRGLGQFGPAEERKYGITDENRTDPTVQTRAVAMEAQENAPALARATGRPATNADLYLAHQQGQAGATALLTNPSLPAWQAIRKYYDSDAIAQQAITGNIPGNNPLKNTPVDQITAQAFTSMWKDKFDGGRSSSQNVSPAGSSGQNVSPAYDILTPAHRDTLIKEGQSIQHAYDIDDKAMQTAQEKAQKQASDSKEIEIFSDLHKNPDNPSFNTQKILDLGPRPDGTPGVLTKDAVERMVNLYEKVTTKADADHDVKTYGDDFYETFQDANRSQGDPRRITDPSELYPKLGHGLTMAGIDKLSGVIIGKRTPDGQSESTMLNQFMKDARSRITGTNDIFHIKDPDGDRLFLDWQTQAFGAYDKGRKDGKSAAQLLNSESPDYIGKSVPILARTLEERMGNVLHDPPKPEEQPGVFSRIRNAISPPAVDPNSVKSYDELKAAFKAGSVTREQAVEAGRKNGWIRADAAPSAPGPETRVPLSAPEGATAAPQIPLSR